MRPTVKIERVTGRGPTMLERVLLAALVLVEDDRVRFVLGWAVIMGLAFLAVWGLS